MSMPTNPGRGTLILVLGILGLLCCAFVGPVAWVMGAGDLKKIAAGQISPEAKGMTQAGMICGIIGSIFLIFWVVWIIFFGGLTTLGVMKAQQDIQQQQQQQKLFK